MKETAKIVEAAKQVAEVLVNNRIIYAEVNRVFRETEHHLSLATNAETTGTRAPYSRFPAESAPESDTENVPVWLKAEREKWRRFELTSEDKSQVDELNDILTQHDLTRRELAVILASLRIRPEFTLDDFHADKDLSASSDRERLIQALLEFTEQTVKSVGLLESNIQALPGVVAVLAGLLAE